MPLTDRMRSAQGRTEPDLLKECRALGGPTGGHREPDRERRRREDLGGSRSGVDLLGKVGRNTDGLDGLELRLEPVSVLLLFAHRSVKD